MSRTVLRSSVTTGSRDAPRGLTASVVDGVSRGTMVHPSDLSPDAVGDVRGRTRKHHSGSRVDDEALGHVGEPA